MKKINKFTGTEVLLSGKWKMAYLKNGVKKNYTCADDGKCTRTNLYNEWVDMKTARTGARVLFGDLTGISATLLDRSLPAMSRIETLEVTFRYEPRK